MLNVVVILGGIIVLTISEVLKELNTAKSNNQDTVLLTKCCVNHCIEKLNLLSKLCAEYQEICQNECEGDGSVGIPPCPFYDFPDVSEDGFAIPGGCKLSKI